MGARSTSASNRAFCAAILRLRLVDSGLAMFVFGIGYLIVLMVILRALQIPDQLLVPDSQFVALRALLGVVLLSKHLVLFYRQAFAAA